MGRRKLKFVLPKLNDCGGKMDKSWYVEYSYRDTKTDKLERFRIYEGFSSLTTTEERYVHANLIIADIANKIAAGWTPFESQIIEYNNTLMYHNQAKVYDSRRRTEKNILYYINVFIEEKTAQLSLKSVQDYKSKLRLFYQWLDANRMDNIYPNELTNEIVSDYILYLINNRKLEKRTISKSKQHLRQLFDYLVKKKIITTNPLYDLPETKQQSDHSAQPMTHKEASHLLEYIKSKDEQLYLFCSMIFYCAIRPGTELRLLKVKDINMFTSTITIRVENGKTGAGIINMPPKLVDILIEMNISSNNRDFYVFGKDGKPGLECWGKNHFRVEFNKYRDEIGFPKEYKLYSWKCTGAILFAMGGAPLTAIRDHCRHKSTAYTDIYLSKRIGKQNDYVKHQFPEL